MKKLEERGVVIRFVIGRRFFHALIHTGYDINTYFLENLMINYLHFESYFTFKLLLTVLIEVIAWIAILMRKTAQQKIS